MQLMDDWELINKTRTEMAMIAMINEHERRLKDVEKRGRMHDESIRMLQDILPSQLAMRRDINGQWEIPEQFWAALQQRLSTDSAPLWEAFLKTHSQELLETVDPRVTALVQGTIKDHNLVSKDVFASAIADLSCNVTTVTLE